MPIPTRFNATFSWSTSALLHVALGGAIAHWGPSAVIWFSDSSSPPGQAITLAARVASASASSDQPLVTTLIRPEATPPQADEKGKYTPQATAVERTLAKTETPQPLLDHGEPVEHFVSAEVTDVVIDRKSPMADQPRVDDDEPAAAPKHAPRRLADPSLSDRDLAADDIDSLPSIAGADEPPRPLPSNASPGYPATARQEGRQGRVTVLMVVSAEGTVIRAEIFKSSGWPDVDAAALATAKTWKFIPAKRHGVPVAHEFTKPWNFRIEN